MHVKIVDEPEIFWYGSARNYSGEKGILDIRHINLRWYAVGTRLATQREPAGRVVAIKSDS